MRAFLNRLRDRGWRNINLRGYTDSTNQVLKRGAITVIGIESINVDASGDPIPQIDAFFNTLIELFERTDAKEVFLPGGGDFPIPEVFLEYCHAHGIKINLLTLESFMDHINYN